MTLALALGLWAERRARIRLEERGRDLVARLAQGRERAHDHERELSRAREAARTETAELERALEARTKEVSETSKRLAKSEARRVEVEMARRKLVDLVGEMAAEANEKRRKDAAAAEGDRIDDPEKRLAAVRAQVALRERLSHALRRYGRARLRVHALESARGGELFGLRLLQLGDDGVPNGLYSAARARIEVDKAKGAATIHLSDVSRTMSGVRMPHVKSWKIHFELEEPRAFVAELSDLIVTKGAWPAPAGAERAATPDEAVAKRIWMERLDSFLEGVDGVERYRLQRVGKVAMPAFFDVEILCMTDKGRLERRIRAARLEVSVDKRRERVALLLRDGYIESVRGKLTLPKDRDYRMELRGVKPAAADRALLGFVRR